MNKSTVRLAQRYTVACVQLSICGRGFEPRQKRFSLPLVFVQVCWGGGSIFSVLFLRSLLFVVYLINLPHGLIS